MGEFLAVFLVITFVTVNHIGQSVKVCGPNNSTISLVYEYPEPRGTVVWRRENGSIFAVITQAKCGSSDEPKYKFLCENGGRKHVLEVNNPDDGEVYYTVDIADNRSVVIQDKGSLNVTVNEEPFLCQLTDTGVQLVCSIGCSKPAPKLIWKFTSNMGGTLQDLSGGVESVITGCSPGYVSKTNTITISNTTPILGGLDGYTIICEASYPGCDNTVTPDQLNKSCSVRPVVHIEPSTSPYKVIEGGQLVLTCQVTNSDLAVPSDIYKWTKNGVQITGQNSSIYRMQPVERSDTGSYYTCTGSNTAGPGRSSTPVQLEVLFGPMVTVSVDSVAKTENDDLQLICTVESNPPPTTFKWYKPDGSSVDVSSNRRLDISNITRNQGGIYRCEATTTLVPTNGSPITRSHNKTIDVTVLYLDPVTLIPTGDKLIVNEGYPTSFTCSADSNPVALITWYSGTTQISSTQSNIDTFTIQQPSCLDTGDYTCHATNTEIPNVQYNQSLKVFINCSPRQDTRVITTSIVSSNIRDIVQLVSDVISYPLPTFTWYYNNITTGDVEPIYNDDVFNQNDTSISINTYRSTLNINIASNIYYTSYTVNVSNNIGYTELEYQVTAQSKPGVPSNINTSAPSHDSICITWTPGFNGGDQQEFIVQHSIDNKTWTSSTPLAESKPDYCIKNLQADTPYYIRVIARNKYGDSQPVYLRVIADSVRTMKKFSSDSDVKNESPDGVVVGVSVMLVLVTIVSILAVLSTIYYRRKYQQILQGSEIPTIRQPNITGFDNNGLMSTYDGLEFSERRPTEGTYQELIQNSTNVDDTSSNRMGDPTYINTRTRI
ncbi:hemicentin-1 isoform X1 [Patella vulgata]|uniref:hemicentin-1 isoform X1 n=1 Tax=Patella vulgata TaxID=6465 RepID=UPI0024A8B29C|nr:hemicentin-1 isoform X1 [Patella vulgata]